MILNSLTMVKSEKLKHKRKQPFELCNNWKNSPSQQLSKPTDGKTSF